MRFARWGTGFLGVLVVLFSWMALAPDTAHAGRKNLIKFSTLAPEGSSWMREMRQMDKALKKATGGKVGFKFYAGGVSGDEKDVLRKMRIGQVHGAGFSGVGLGEILPEVRVLDLPFLYRNNQEIEHIYQSMNDYFYDRFEEKGYILLGWVPVGWIHFFSKNEIRTVADLQKTKAWMWEGDPLVEEAYRALNVSPFPLSLPDVMLSLQTGMIDTVYSSPVGALAFQWFTKVQYMSQIHMGNSTGAVLITKKRFDKLSGEHQATLKRIAKKHLNNLVKTVQKDNATSIEVMKKKGLKLSPLPSEAETAQFEKIGEVVRDKLTGKLFPKSLLDKVLSHLKEVPQSPKK